MQEKREKFLKKTKEKIAEAFKSRDMLLVAVSNAIEDLDSEINVIGERLEEWYGIYFPELKVDNKVNYAHVVLTFDKNNKDVGQLAKIVGKEKAELIIKDAQTSLGADFQKNDLEECRAFARLLIMLDELRKRYKEYEKNLCKEICPNTSYVAGSEIAAKLIAHVGSLSRLAVLPASTIQVLGAEKALFKHLKNRKIAPPKHGIIFQHPMIAGNPKKVRGKIARLLANKIAQAVKADAFTKNFIGEKLKNEFEARCNEILEEYKSKKEKER
jgi:nucleolar protein 56